MKTLQSKLEVRPDQILFTDTETYSEVDIRECGTVKYCENAEMLLAGFTKGDKEFIWDMFEGVHPPEWVIEHIDEGGYVCAHNAIFDYLILKKHIPQLTLEQMIDTQAMCGIGGLPLSLEKAGKELHLPSDQQKLKDGKRLIKIFSIPRKPTKLNPLTRVLPENAPEEWEKFKEYLIGDIVSMRAMFSLLPPLTEWEQIVYTDTQKVNLSGVPIDLSTCQLIIDKLEHLIDEESSKFIRITGIFPGQLKRVKEWVIGQGVNIPNLQAATVASVLDNPRTPEHVQEALEARANTTHMSFKKFPTMVSTACSDGFVRGTLQYHAASTGRFGGRLIQTQNLTRGKIDGEEAVERILNGEFTVELVKSSVRSMIHCPNGFSVADYSGIEARFLQWVCQDDVALQIFRDGKDPYKWMASKIFGVSYDEVTDDQRFTGKQAILGLGYQMSAKKFISMCANYGVEMPVQEANLAVKIYRETHKNAVRLWGSMQKAATMAMQRPNVQIKVNKYVSFEYDGDRYLMMHLPSGRSLYYYQPRLEVSNWGDMTFSYMSVNEKNQYVRTNTYGGKLTENLVQAGARDLLVHGIHNLLEEGYNVITHIHDEVVVEGVDHLDEVIRLICDKPDWAEGLPLEAEGFTTTRFKKG